MYNAERGFTNQVKFFQALGIFFFFFSGDNDIFRILESSKEPNKYSMTKNIILSVIFEGLIYLFIAVCGYLSVPIDVVEIAIERKKIWRAKIVMTIARILLIPMAISKIQKKHNIWRNRFSEFCYTVDVNKLFYCCFTAFTLLVTTIISTFYQNILGYISLIGSFFVVFPAFFLPPLIYQ